METPIIKSFEERKTEFEAGYRKLVEETGIALVPTLQQGVTIEDLRKANDTPAGN